jgi:hypothetical protein
VARVSVDQRRNDLVEAAFRVMSQIGIGQATSNSQDLWIRLVLVSLGAEDEAR